MGQPVTQTVNHLMLSVVVDRPSVESLQHFNISFQINNFLQVFPTHFIQYVPIANCTAGGEIELILIADGAVAAALFGLFASLQIKYVTIDSFVHVWSMWGFCYVALTRHAARIASW